MTNVALSTRRQSVSPGAYGFNETIVWAQASLVDYSGLVSE
jgi:hypothetical protein